MTEEEMNEESTALDEVLDAEGNPINDSDLPVNRHPPRPLPNKLHERFANYCAQMIAGNEKLNKTAAYMKASPRPVTRSGAASSAQRLYNKPRVAERIAHLSDEMIGNASPGSDEVEIDITALGSKQGIIDTLKVMLANGELPRGSDRIRALLQLFELQGFHEEHKADDWIDPSHVLAWMASVEMDGMTVMQAIEKQESFDRLVVVMAKLLDAERVLVERCDASAEFRRNGHKSTQYERVDLETNTPADTCDDRASDCDSDSLAKK